MAATRLRTENWKRSLKSLYERGGALEISLAGAPQVEREIANLIWRVRILSLDEESIVVEQPAAFGQPIQVNQGSDLVAIIVIGQNRWMFKTQNLGLVDVTSRHGRQTKGLRLPMPENVERCQRRNFYRVTTVGLNLPQVECYPLLDSQTAAMAEAANRVHIQDLNEAAISGRAVDTSQPPVLPEVGPSFGAKLVNVGGGGAGLLIEPEDRPKLDSDRLFWMCINLEPDIPAPLGVAGRLKHTHIDSLQRVYAGMAFEFGFDPKHQKFIVDQLCRYAANLQRADGA